MPAMLLGVRHLQYKKQVDLLADIRRRDEDIAKYTRIIGQQMERWVCEHGVVWW
jgi:hypothetical protein